MKIVFAAAVALAFSAGAAHADTAANTVARLVTSVCMPAIQTLTAPPSLPTGGVLMTTAQKKTMGMDLRSTAWIYSASDDKVVLEMGAGGCNIIAQNTGDETYLAVLEKAVGAKYPKTYVDNDQETGGGLRWRNYIVPLETPAEGGPSTEALSVTYATKATPPAGRMFFVGVLASGKQN